MCRAWPPRRRGRLPLGLVGAACLAAVPRRRSCEIFSGPFGAGKAARGRRARRVIVGDAAARPYPGISTFQRGFAGAALLGPPRPAAGWAPETKLISAERRPNSPATAASSHLGGTVAVSPGSYCPPRPSSRPSSTVRACPGQIGPGAAIPGIARAGLATSGALRRPRHARSRARGSPAFADSRSAASGFIQTGNWADRFSKFPRRRAMRSTAPDPGPRRVSTWPLRPPRLALSAALARRLR